MLIRLLVLIFALNAFAPAAMASSCDMLNDMSFVSHHISSDITMQDMPNNVSVCNTDQDNSCKSTECVTSCAANLSILQMNTAKSFVTRIMCKHPEDNLLSLYETFHAIKTPPPLV